MEGELSGPVSLRSYSDLQGEDVSDEQENGARTFPAEDAAEVMVQVALRTDRIPTPRSRNSNPNPADRSHGECLSKYRIRR
mmetsp:Transcript_42785/g.43335  ORF Transcript_42785/g.43335 Transcript_42785/m.43335 type:complete len:81 (-) Transcript_42785:88-330(-)